MSTTPDEATADPSRLCDEARRLAETGELDRAAGLFRRVLGLGEVPERAQAALGLAVVLDDSGDAQGAREADRVAIGTGDPEYAPRAAYHLALTYERAGERDAAAAAWRSVVDFGNPAYLPPALLALGQWADDAGDIDAALDWWERAVATHDPQYAPLAAHDLAQRLLEQGEPARAQRALAAALRLIDRDAAPYAYARLALAIGVAYLDQAIGAFGTALSAEDAESDPEVGPLATELLARTLPLRGRATEAGAVWRRGLAVPGVEGEVRARLRRGFGGQDGDVEVPWWEQPVETAVIEGTLPALAGEVFGALDHIYALAALRYTGDADGLPPELRDLLGRAVRVPSEYAWGRRLHDSFAERLQQAMGEGAPDLPPDWPGR